MNFNCNHFKRIRMEETFNSRKLFKLIKEADKVLKGADPEFNQMKLLFNDNHLLIETSDFIQTFLADIKIHHNCYDDDKTFFSGKLIKLRTKTLIETIEDIEKDPIIAEYRKRMNADEDDMVLTVFSDYMQFTVLCPKTRELEKVVYKIPIFYDRRYDTFQDRDEWTFLTKKYYHNNLTVSKKYFSKFLKAKKENDVESIVLNFNSDCTIADTKEKNFKKIKYMSLISKQDAMFESQIEKLIEGLALLKLTKSETLTIWFSGSLEENATLLSSKDDDIEITYGFYSPMALKRFYEEFTKDRYQY